MLVGRYSLVGYTLTLRGYLVQTGAGLQPTITSGSNAAAEKPGSATLPWAMLCWPLSAGLNVDMSCLSQKESVSSTIQGLY